MFLTAKTTRGLLAALTALTLAWTNSANAQNPTPIPGQTFSVPASAFIVPALGQPSFFSDSDGTNIVREEGNMVVRPAPPEANAFSTSLEYETWGSGVVQGFNRLSGDRVTGLFNFVRGRDNDTEISVSVPIQHVSIDNQGSSSGIGDVNVAFRKYFYDPSDPTGLTIIASLRGSVSTGNANRAIGLGRPTVGPSISFYKPIGQKAIAYAGGGINFAFGSSLGLRLKNSPYAFVGGQTRISDRIGLKAEANFFQTPFDESYARIMIGPQLYLSENQFVQLNIRKELQAVGKPTAFSVGYSSQF